MNKNFDKYNRNQLKFIAEYNEMEDQKNTESINNWENLMRTAEKELPTIKLLRGKK
jgi:hypothetical protein